MTIAAALSCVAVLLAIAPLAVVIGRTPAATPVVYGLSFAASSALAITALAELLTAHTTASAVTLPLGLPWLGAHFRIDALAAFFLFVVNLGAAAASVFALGYGRHEGGAASRVAVLSGLPRRHESRRDGG